MSLNVADEFRQVFKSENTLIKVILINIIVFIAFNLISLFYPISTWFALPGDATDFIFRFWSLITYMFLHAGLMHIFFNMVWLYWMGKLLVEYLGNKRFLAIYFLGGMAGGLAYLLVYNLMDVFGMGHMGSHLVGASAGVMAVVIAAAVLLPDYIVHLLFLGPVRLKYIGLGILILTSILDFNINTGGKLAHLGGAAVGYFFIRMLRNGHDYSVPFFQVIHSITSPFLRKKPLRVVKSTVRETTSRQHPDDLTEAQRQRKIDAILDKISKSGYDGLTAEEKDFLFRAGGKK